MSGRTDRQELDIIDAIIASAGNVEGADIVDIGSGTGALCRALNAKGANVTGIEPSAEAVAIARDEGSGPRYLEGTTEELNLPARSFDLVIFCTSLHHISDMNGTLQESRRMLKPQGRVIIVEPEADDPLYPVVCWIDDERAVYLEAQQAIDSIAGSGKVERGRPLFYFCKYRVENADTMIEHLLSVDDQRTIAAAARAGFDAAYDKAVRFDNVGAYFNYWYRLDQLYFNR